MNKKRLPIEAILIIVTVLIVIGFGLWGYFTDQSLKQTYRTNQSQIDELTKQLNSISTEEPKTEVVTAQLNSASDAGNTLTEYQNWKLSTVNADFTPEFESEMKQKSDEIDPYLQDKNNRVAWYYYDSTNPNVNPVWSFCTTYSFSGNTVPVLWVCYNQAKDNELLAYAQGTYHADDNMFYDLEYHVTAIGDSYGPGSEGYGAVNDYDDETSDSSEDVESTDTSETESATETIE